MSVIDVISDYSHQNLEQIPNDVMKMFNLKMLYLEDNLIRFLPENFFERLGRLTWLDLRQNKLTTLPAGIANHSFLETILLQDNEIEYLPNEVGLLPNLKVLQLSGNPLKYPVPEVLAKGIGAICAFLKDEYRKLNSAAENDEVELQVVDLKSSVKSKKSDKLSVQQILRNSAHERLGSDNEQPIISVKSLTRSDSEVENEKGPNNDVNNEAQTKNIKKTHKIIKSNSTVMLHSHSYLTGKGKNKEEENKELTEIWFKRLRDLLEDQEKILQQEKNLNALNKWRLTKKMEVPRCSKDSTTDLPPYDTDPEFSKMLSRKDLSQQIDDIIKKNKQRNSNKKTAPTGSDVQKLINEVVDQMKNMETKLSQMGTPRSEQETAAREIKSILDLHKTILALQEKNDNV